MRMSHTLTVLSVPAEAIHVPLGWNSTWFTNLKHSTVMHMFTHYNTAERVKGYRQQTKKSIMT